MTDWFIVADHIESMFWFLQKTWKECINWLLPNIMILTKIIELINYINRIPWFLLKILKESNVFSLIYWKTLTTSWRSQTTKCRCSKWKYYFVLVVYQSTKLKDIIRMTRQLKELILGSDSCQGHLKNASNIVYSPWFLLKGQWKNALKFA